MLLRVLMIVVLLAGCGVSADDEDTLCSNAPIATQGSEVTQFACAYEQQTYNIKVHGTVVSESGTTLQDATGTSVGTVQYKCGRFLMGKDPNGVAVIINAGSGSVQSHGSVHPGFPVSSLSHVLPTPLTY